MAWKKSTFNPLFVYIYTPLLWLKGHKNTPKYLTEISFFLTFFLLQPGISDAASHLNWEI